MTMRRRIRKTISKVCEQCHGTYTIPAHRFQQKYCSHSCATTNVSRRRPKFADRIYVKKEERLPDPNQQQVDAATRTFLAQGGRIKRLNPQTELVVTAVAKIEDEIENERELNQLKATKERKNNLKAP